MQWRNPCGFDVRRNPVSASPVKRAGNDAAYFHRMQRGGQRRAEIKQTLQAEMLFVCRDL